MLSYEGATRPQDELLENHREENDGIPNRGSFPATGWEGVLERGSELESLDQNPALCYHERFLNGRSSVPSVPVQEAITFMTKDAKKEPARSHTLTTTSLVIGIVGAVIMFGATCGAFGLYLGSMKAETKADLTGVRSDIGGLGKTLERLDKELADRQNPLSLVNEVANVGRRVDMLDHSLYGLIARLHPEQATLVDQSEREYHRRAAPPASIGLVLPITPAPNPAAIYIHPSSVVPGMFALTLPPEHLGKSVGVQAMRGGKVLSIFPDSHAPGRKAVDITLEFGYRQRYSNLDDVIVAEGSAIEQGVIFGHATPTPEACVRIGILDPLGRFMDPRLFLPPLKDPPQ